MSMQTRESDTAVIRTSAHLVVKSGLMEGTSVPLNAGQVTTIGRANTNRLVIPDEICSRNHCEVFFDGGSWKLRDLGSRNGTRVGGEPISGDIQLQEGRHFQIGGTTILFTFEPRTWPTGDDAVRVDTVASSPVETVRADIRSTSTSDNHPEIIHLTDKTRYILNDAEALSCRDRAGLEPKRLAGSV